MEVAERCSVKGSSYWEQRLRNIRKLVFSSSLNHPSFRHAEVHLV